jgi:transposase
MYTLGMDLAKDSFTACLLDEAGGQIGKVESSASSAAGLRKLVKWLPDAPATRAVFESTGVYGKPIIHGLHGLLASLHQLNPRTVKRFATSMTQTKTDHADAAAIARVGHMLALSQPGVLDHAAVVFAQPREDLCLWTAEYHRLRVDAVRLKCRMDGLKHNPAPAATEILDLHRAQLKSLLQRTKLVAAKMAQAFSVCDEGTMNLLQSIPGIGPVASSAIAAKVPCIDRFRSADALKGFLGMYPRRTQSGRSEGPSRMAHHGPALVRGVLWNCAKSAARYNPACKALFLRLRAKGLHAASCYGAVVRQLVQIIYGVLKHKKPFDPTRHLAVHGSALSPKVPVSPA